MPVKIRLQRHGKKGKPFYWVVAADVRAKRDGKFLEKLGIYNPNTNPAIIEINVDNSVKWLQNGAQPTETARRILSYKGVLLKKHLIEGVKKGALTEEQVEERFEAWLAEKDKLVAKKTEGLAKAKAEAKAKALAAEKEANEKRMMAAAAADAPAEEEAEAVEAGEEVAVEAAVETEATETVEETAEAPEAPEAPEAEVQETAEQEEAPVAEENAEAAVEAAEEAAKEEEPKAEVAEPEAEVAEEAPAAEEAVAEEAADSEETKASAEEE